MNVTDRRQTDRRQTTDGRTTTYSEHEHELTFAKNRVLNAFLTKTNLSRRHDALVKCAI